MSKNTRYILVVAECFKRLNFCLSFHQYTANKQACMPSPWARKKTKFIWLFGQCANTECRFTNY